MSLPPGTRLGPFEVVSSIGSGGMGEVYRARDRRLAREVAVKVLKPQGRFDPERLRRFQEEARAMSAVSHPGLLAVFEVGETDGAPYLVTELLEGETLRERLKHGPLPLRKALDYARQVAHALAAAHEKGIVHRDLKPENLFLSRDGRVKILDFGLARLAEPDAAGADDQSATAGRVFGTAGYMSPEQVRGETVDARSDIFAFGAILYEMVAGQRAFRGATAVETMNGILKEDPPQLAETSPGIPAAVARVVWHCLEKNPAERFQSARDLAFDLETLEDYSSGSFARQGEARRRRRVPASAAALLLGLLAGAAAHRLLSREGPPPIPSLSRLTFRRGTIEAARFSPDGQVVYGAFWDGAPVELFFARPGSPESRPLGFSNTELLALSRSGELALSLGRRRVGTFVGTGTLAQAPLAGGAPREVQEDVQLADWSPSGGLAVVRSVAGRNRLEHPIGTVLFETSGWVSDPRVSPSGDRIAFVDHPVWGDDGGNVAVVDLAGNVRRLTRDWNSLQGLAWSPRGDEVWFTGTRQGAARALNAVALDGSERALARMAGTLTLHDVQQNGRALVSHQVLRREMRALAPGAAEERDLSWLDYAYPSDFSDDGSTIFFAENGEGGGRGYSVYVRHSDGSPAVRLGVGAAMAMSPDRKLVFANQNYTSDEQRWMLIPTGPGQPRTLDRGSVRAFAASFFPGGERLAIVGSEPGRPTRVYVLDVASGGPPKPIAAEGTSFPLSGRPVSPEGRWLALRVADGSHAAHPVDGGTPRPLRGIGPDEQVIRWSAAGEALYVYRPGEIPAVVVRVDPATGRRDVVKRIQPADRAGVVAVTPVLLTPDAASYVYGFRRVLSDLYVVEGLR